jgi:hypothetical protein
MKIKSPQLFSDVLSFQTHVFYVWVLGEDGAQRVESRWSGSAFLGSLGSSNKPIVWGSHSVLVNFMHLLQFGSEEAIDRDPWRWLKCCFAFPWSSLHRKCQLFPSKCSDQNLWVILVLSYTHTQAARKSCWLNLKNVWNIITSPISPLLPRTKQTRSFEWIVHF